MTLGERISAYRRAQRIPGGFPGFTQSACAARCGMSQSRWADLEADRSETVTLETLGRLADGLQVDASDLIEGLQNTPKPPETHRMPPVSDDLPEIDSEHGGNG